MTEKIESTPENWENGKLGQDAQHAAKVVQTPEEDAALDAAFGLKAISIRLESEMIDQYKLVASHYGMGYQPLMRQALHRFVEAELKKIAIDAMTSEKEMEITFPKAA